MRQRQPRIHNAAHLDFIRSLPCILTGTTFAVQAAHIRFADNRVAKRPVGMGEKPDDMWTLPLTAEQHCRQHSMSERAFWDEAGIDPILYALALFAHSGNYELGCQIVASADNKLMARK